MIAPQPAPLPVRNPDTAPVRPAGPPAEPAGAATRGQNARERGRHPLGRILLEQGALDPGDLVRALAIQARQDVRLGDIMVSHGMIGEHALMQALALQYDTALIDCTTERPDPRLIDRVGAANCLRNGCLPWRRIGGVTLVATSRPDAFEGARPALEAALGPVVMGLLAERDLHAAILRTRSSALELLAETCVSEQESCRTWSPQRLRRTSIRLGLAAVLLLAFAPTWLFLALFAVVTTSLLASSALRVAATLTTLRARASGSRGEKLASRPVSLARLPMVSVMVPLFREPDIAPRLVRRLGALTYPKELLDVLLVVEADDTLTRDALARRRLPHWMRVIVVPESRLRTKPRALNFAMAFARGTIIGIYDAEDAPEPDQLHRVVRRFYERGSDLACVQGVLDYYNPETNWLARCFTIEYAAWFRLILPGVERLGLAVPLGGTTLFFRRRILEALGGWDAHNVTEDADLGIRLARHGYRTELLETVTREEANCRVIPWIRQRSRWLKGYAMTYAVHMRDPRLLLQQLGPRKFLGFQVMFLGTLVQFVLAPVLWSFWLVPLGVWHPLSSIAPTWALVTLAAVFAASELVSVAVNLCAVNGRGHRFLRIWVPVLHFYFPLASLAAYKGLWELIARPFYWDKTAHGLFDAATRPVSSVQRPPNRA